MKKSLFIITVLAMMLFCGCEKDPADNPGGGNTPATIDITPYLGTYLAATPPQRLT